MENAEVSSYVSVVGTIIFIAAWALMAFRIPFFPIGRTAGTLLCAVLMLACRILEPADAFAAINIETLALLFGSMVMTIVLEREGMFALVIRLLMLRCNSARILLLRVSLVCAGMAAFVTNDTVCVFITPVVGKLCHDHNLPYVPFLLAVATSANIGSSATPVGNPQNMIIASFSHLGFVPFLSHCALAAVVMLAFSISFMMFLYRQELDRPLLISESDSLPAETDLAASPPVSPTTHPVSVSSQCRVHSRELMHEPPRQHSVIVMDSSGVIQVQPACSSGFSFSSSLDISNTSRDATVHDIVSETSEIMASLQLPSQTTPHSKFRLQRVSNSDEASVLEDSNDSSSLQTAPSQLDLHKPRGKLAGMSIIFLGTIVAFIAGAPLGWAAVAGASAMLAFDRQEPDGVLREVDWGLLVFFAALFVVVRGFERTSLPAETWAAAIPHLDMETPSGLALFTVIVVVGSNTVSNVPLTLLMSSAITQLSRPEFCWLQLAYIATVAGNLTLVGSVANLIVAERAKKWHRLTFFEYLRFGLPSTLVVVLGGVVLISLTF